MTSLYEKNKNTLILLLLVLILVNIIFLPIVVIWAVNTLFAVGMAYNFTNWLAVSILLLVFGQRIVI